MPRGIPLRKRARPEVQEEFARIREQVTSEREGSTDKELAEIRHREQEARKLVEGVSVEGVVGRLAELGVDVTKALANLSGQLVGEVERLTQIREAVALEERELARLHQLDVAATALDQLVETHEAQRATLEAEIASQRTTWAAERQAHFRDEKEAEELQKKQRQRESDDFEYRRALERKRTKTSTRKSGGCRASGIRSSKRRWRNLGKPARPPLGNRRRIWRASNKRRPACRRGWPKSASGCAPRRLVPWSRASSSS